MRLFSSWPIRVHLFVLVMAAILPALGIIVLTGMERRSEAIEKARQDILSLAQGVAIQQENITNSTRQLLMTISQIPMVGRRDAKACEHLLNDLLIQNPSYAAINIASPEGVVFASAPRISPFSIADRKYYRDILRTKKFSIGEYILSRSSGHPVFHYAYPVLDSGGKLKAIVVAAFNASYYDKYFAIAKLPTGSALALTDGAGIRLYRYPAFEQYAGKKDLPEMIERMSSPTGEGSFFAAGVDGKRRLYGFKRVHLDGEKRPYLYIRVGIPEEMVLAVANRALMRNLGLLGIASLLALVVAQIIGNIIIVRRINALVATSRQLGHGNLKARTNLPYEDNEIGHLSRSLDEMAALLEERHEESRRAKEKIGQLKFEREQILNSAAEGIIRVDTEGNNVFVNPAAARMLGYEADDLLEKSSHRTFHYTKADGTPYPEWECPIHEAYRDGKIHHVNEEVFWKKDGVAISVEYSSTPIKENDVVVGAVLSFQDITERKQAEEAIRDGERLVHSIIDGSPIPAFVIGKNHRVIHWNKALEKVSRVKSEEVVGTSKHWMAFYSEERPCMADLLVDEAVAVIPQWYSGKQIKPLLMEGAYEATDFFPAMGEDGKWLRFTAAAIRDSKGMIVAAIETLLDITERKQAEEERKNIEAQLFQSQKMEAIGSLAGGIAHDFNNILSVIIGYTELAMDKNQKEDTEKYLQETLNGAKRAKNLVKQILTFSRQDDHTEKKPLDIKILLKEAIKFIRSSIPTTIEIDQQITKEECNIMADTTQMHQIIMNLFTNAAHAMKQTGGTLTIELATIELAKDEIPHHPELQPGHYIKLTISDTGYGIYPAIVQRIFDPFFTTKSVDEGTGLGLSVVYGIVKGHGGVINVYSEQGKGAVFNIYLPRIIQTETMEVDADKPVIGGTERILFVDDEPALVDIGMRILFPLGYHATGATSSMEALELFRAGPQRFDLVITDMTLPKMTGIDLSREILKIRPDIPIILCSGIKDPDTAAQAKALGIKAYLTKPLTRRELAGVMREVLEKKAEGEEKS